MIERRIKELSIALEALSRINRFDAAQAYDSVSELLATAIQMAKDSAHPEAARPQQPATPRGLDDEIPF